MAKGKILVVDDEEHILELIRYNLDASGYEVIEASDGDDAVKKAINEVPDLILLDLMLPGKDGYDVCRELRSNGKTKAVPIIMLTAKSEEIDKILGLELGADDYITKPFNHLELVARVKSQLRRYEKPLNVESGKDIIKVKDLVIDTIAKKITVRGEEVKVTATEYKILYLLASNLGKVFSIKEIYEKVWEENFYKSENTVTVHIRRIREKIEINTKEPEYIKVVWGIGYKIEKDN